MTSEELYAKYHRLVWRVARTMQRSYALSDEDVEGFRAEDLRWLSSGCEHSRCSGAYRRALPEELGPRNESEAGLIEWGGHSYKFVYSKEARSNEIIEAY